MRILDFKPLPSLAVLAVCFVVAHEALVQLVHAEPTERLRVSDNGHFLATQSGRPVFLLADTAWGLIARLKREDLAFYLRQRQAQGFNTIAFVLYSPGNQDIADGTKNVYDQPPFKLVNGRPDPTQPALTPGSNPAIAAEYDYWDQVDFAVTETKRLGLYAIVLPCWGSAVVGEYSGKPSPDQIFDAGSARAYGQWLGRRYGAEPHLLWMLGGDRKAVYGERDFRPVFRSLAEGLAQGGAQQLKSFHPPKNSLQSGDWFHHDDWLSFNSIQHWPEDQVDVITRDWNAQPAKPTWVFEPRYEGYWKKPYTAADWGEWQTRQQAYQSVFAGGFGFTYGHERIFGFGKDGWDWKQELNAPGATQLRQLTKLLGLWQGADYFSRVPDQSLLEGNQGNAKRFTSDRLTATRNADATLAMIYSANGRAVRIRLEQLSGPVVNAFWFNTRTGRWRVGNGEGESPKPFAADIASGVSAMSRAFQPPGGAQNGNDWVLVLANAAKHFPETTQ